MIKNLINKAIKFRLVVATACLTAMYASPILAAPDPSIQLTKVEQDWLASHSKVNLGIDRAFPPFGSIDTNNEYVGFTADIMALIAKKLDIEFNVQKQSSWSETIDLAKQAKIDMIAGLVNTPERSKYLYFTSSYVNNPSIIVNDLDKNGYIGTLKNLNTKTVAVESDSFASDMMGKDYPQI